MRKRIHLQALQRIRDALGDYEGDDPIGEAVKRLERLKKTAAKKTAAKKTA